MSELHGYTSELEQQWSADRGEEQPSRFSKEKQEREKRLEIEKLKVREQLNLATAELKKIQRAAEQTKDSSLEAKYFFDRVTHTLNAVESSVNGLEIDGEHKGFSKIIIKDAAGNQANWPDGTAAFQYEGVPVDQMIDLLAQQAKQMREADQQKYKLLKDKVKNFNEKYNNDQQREEKALDYSQLEQAQKELREMEENFDNGGSAESKQLSDLASELTKRSKPYFERHYGRADLSAQPLTKEESDRQHLRTQHEAYLMAQDHRSNSDLNREEAMRQDYEQAMGAMNKRRELILEQEVQPAVVETPAPDVVEVPVHIEAPEKVVPPPEVIPKVLDLKEFPEKNRLLALDITDLGERLAYIRADKRLNELLNAGKGLNVFEYVKTFGFKGLWTRWKHRAAEGHYRQKFIAEEKESILSQQQHAGLLGQGGRAKLNLHRTEKDGEKWQAENDAEFKALIERFQDDLLMNADSKTGEKKKALSPEQKEYSDKINQLMNDYINPSAGPDNSAIWMTDEQFEIRKDNVLADLRQNHPEYFDGSKLSIDDFLETAKEYRKVREHTEGLARVDNQFEVDLGIARAAIKNKVHLEGFDRFVEKIQETPVLGRFLTPTVVGSLASFGAYFAKKPAYIFGLAFGGGMIVGAARKHKEVNADMMMHRTERAMGIQMDQFKGKGNAHRHALEKFTYDMRNVTDIKSEMDTAAGKFDLEKNEANTKALIEQIADIEARMTLDEKEHLDLIQYEGVTQLERGRLDLMRSLAEAKVLLGSEHNQEIQQVIGQRISEMQQDIKVKNTKLGDYRGIEIGKAAVFGGVAAVTFGALTQYGAAKVGDWLHMDRFFRPDGKSTAIEKFLHIGRARGQEVAQQLKPNLDAVPGIDAARAHLPVGTHLQSEGGGLFALVADRGGKVLSDHIKFGAEGHIIARGHDYVPLAIDSRLDPNGTHRVGILDDVRQRFHDQLSKIKRADWYRNAKVNISDENELKLRFGGEHGSGYDAQNNVVFDMTHFKEGKSWIQEGPNMGKRAQHIAEGIKNGSIKDFFIPDKGHSSDVIELKANSHGQTIPNEALNHYAIKGPDGKPILPGLVTVSERQPNGTYIDIATYVGKGSNSIESHNVITTFSPKSSDTDWLTPPLVFKFPRKPQEDYELYDEEDIKARENKRRNAGRGGNESNEDDLVSQPFDLSDFKPKFSHVTRGQGLEGEIDISPGYPIKEPKIYTDQELAASYLRGGIFSEEDANAIKDTGYPKALEYMTDKVKLERQRIQASEIVKKLPEYMEAAAKSLKETYSNYTKNLNALPDIKNIVAIGNYETLARKPGTISNAIMNPGTAQIFINIDRFASMPEEQRIATIKSLMIHELTHAIDANNYWVFENKIGDEKVYAQRRTGLKFSAIRSRADSGRELVERGRAFNEGIKEELSSEAAKNMLGNDYKPEYIRGYAAERAVVRALMDAKKIDLSLLAEASLDRKALPKLIRALAGPDKKQREYFEVLLALMDYESNNGQTTYPKTMDFIRGFPVTINASRMRQFPVSLKDKNGRIKYKIMKKYNLKTPLARVINQTPEQQSSAALPVAA